MFSKNAKRYIRGRKPQRERKKNRYYAFDIECAGLNPVNPLLICVVPFEKYSSKVESDYIFQGKNCKKQFKSWLDSLPKSKKHILFAHNGSRFDIYSVFDKWEILASKKFERNGSIFYIEYNENVEFRDSRHILQAPLSAFGAKGITPPKFIDESHPDYGDYEKINQNDIDYCLQDCRVLINALVDLKTLYRQWTGHPNPALPLTAASLAHRVFTARYWPQKWRRMTTHGKNKGTINFMCHTAEESERVAQKAYYGGRVQILEQAGISYSDVISLDRNSMYPAVMMNDFPDPTTVQRVNNLDLIRNKNLYYWGYFELDGSMASRLFLPAYDEEGRRNYSKKSFEGYLCSPEVEYALEHGWQIINFLPTMF